MKYTNVLNIFPLLAPWLIDDDYDGYNIKAISATGLLKPIREVILKRRLLEGSITQLGEVVQPVPLDISTLLRPRIGQSLHGSLENMWVTGRAVELLAQIDPEKAEIYSKLAINPDYPIDPRKALYIEKREVKEIVPGISIQGKYDIVDRGTLNDYKSGLAFLDKKDKFDEYQKQGSIYRLISPDKIIDDHALFHEIYMDWSPKLAQVRQDYPDVPINTKEIPLLSLEDTTSFVMDRIKLIQEHENTPEPELPECTDYELWVGPTQYKYYTKMEQSRATKNFGTDLAAAQAYLSSKGGVGFIKSFPGEAKRCLYCPVFQVCTQKDKLIDQDRLSI
jgi:hypothetical protein